MIAAMMKSLVALAALMIALPHMASAQVRCSQIGERINCTDYTSAPEPIESKNGEDVWFENRRLQEEHQEAQKKRIDAEIVKMQKADIDRRKADEDRVRSEKDLAKMLGKNDPVKVDTDGFYE